MAVALQFRLPFGQLHATPWGRDANEGEVEWPPSPWRILRALLWSHHVTAPGLDRSDVESTLRALSDPPVYRLPETRYGHTRHYVPSLRNTPDTPGKNRTKVFDAFLAFDPDQPLTACWPTVDLDERCRRTLSQLAAGVSYLGRSESPCTVAVTFDQLPREGADRLEVWEPTEDEVIRVEDVPLLRWDPEAGLACLEADTQLLQKSRRRLPEGCVSVRYRRTSSRAESETPHSAVATPVSTAVWALSGPGRPSSKLTLNVTECLRLACLSSNRRTRGEALPSAFLSGRLPDSRRPRRDQHRHAHYLALPGADGLIEYLAVWTPENMPVDTEPDLPAILAGVRRVRPPGDLKTFATQPLTLAGIGPRSLLGPWAAATTRHHGVTPYIPTRFPKKGDLSSHIVADVSVELGRRDLPAAEVRVSELSEKDWRTRRITRRGFPKGPRPVQVDLTFESPVAGPLLLGRQSHFGFGLFRPEPG